MCKLKQETVNDILSFGKIFEVGGAVRDKFLFGTSSKDRDYIVTGIPYNDLSKLLKKHGRVDLVGRSFGVIKFTQHINDKQITFDITLPRKEFSTGTGHKDFEVDFDPDLKIEDDLKRRDFTINAMAMALNGREFGRLIDPFGGRSDLEEGVISVLYKSSFVDDPTRIFRAVRFEQRFGFKIGRRTEALIKEAINSGMPDKVEGYRIKKEVDLISKEPEPALSFTRLRGLGYKGKEKRRT